MSIPNHHWAVVLAAGEGSRLREVTTRRGVATPKQFCSLRGGRSLLAEAVERAGHVVPRKRVLTIVAEEHRPFFEAELADAPRSNVVVQPRNRGTAAGILLPTLAILERDPEARIAFLPSDHFVAREEVIEASLRIALNSLEEAGTGLTLLGITPEAPETGYGWIVPAASDRLLRPVECFVEKPSAAIAAGLMARGALWNSFLFTVKGSTLIELYEEFLPELLRQLRAAHAGDPRTRAARLAAAYESLSANDFSRDVLQGNEGRLRLELVPPCGWTDLGTPDRLRSCLESLESFQLRPSPTSGRKRAAFDLSFALESLVRSRGGHAAFSV